MPTQTSRTETHRADPTKAHGIVYTPASLARLLAKKAIQYHQGPVRDVLDPACGDGGLLNAVANESREPSSFHFVGLDRDPAAVVNTEKLFLGKGLNGAAFQGDFLASLNDTLLDNLQLDLRDSFDMVIANPPYVRTQTMGEDQAKALARQFGLVGRVDLYQAFAYGMASALRTGGTMALLCPNRVLFTRSGRSVRDLLTNDFEIHEIIDLGDTKLFEAAVLPAIIIASKGGRQESPPNYSATYELAKANEDSNAPLFEDVPTALLEGHSGDMLSGDGQQYVVRTGRLRTSSSTAQPWTLSTPETEAFLSQVREHTAARFGDVSSIRVGIKTTADKVFVRSNWDEMGEDVRPEDELLHPLITHREVQRWNIGEPSRQVLYPHEDFGGHTKAVDLERFPRSHAYLLAHKEQLAGRSYISKSGRAWYEVWVPQKADLWSQTKVVFPDIAVQPRFAVDMSGAIVNGDCYWMRADDADLAHLVAAVGNSPLIERYYDAVCGNLLYSGRRRFMTQYVRDFPLPDPKNKYALAAIENAKRLSSNGPDSDLEAENTDLVGKAFGFSDLAKEIGW